MSEKLEDALKSFLKNGKDWERKPTTVPGIFILKLPEYRRTPPRLVVELNPVDEYGRPMKRRGLVLRSSEELKLYRDLIDNERLDRLINILDQINPKAVKRKGPEEAFEI